MQTRWRLAVAVFVLAPFLALAAEPLPSWNDGPSKAAIVTFVGAVTQSSGKDYVPPEERIATFDNDGTLWSELPLYVQFKFMLDQVKAAAPKHPEWKDNAVFQALMANDVAKLGEVGAKPILELLAVANSGMTVEEYDRSIRDWLAASRHPRFNLDDVMRQMTEDQGSK